MERKEFSKKTKQEAKRKFAIKSLMDIPELVLGNIEVHHKNPCEKGGSDDSRNAEALSHFEHNRRHKKKESYVSKLFK